MTTERPAADRHLHDRRASRRARVGSAGLPTHTASRPPMRSIGRSPRSFPTSAIAACSRFEQVLATRHGGGAGAGAASLPDRLPARDAVARLRPHAAARHARSAPRRRPHRRRGGDGRGRHRACRARARARRPSAGIAARGRPRAADPRSTARSQRHPGVDAPDGADDWRVRRAAVTTLAEHGDAIVESLVRDAARPASQPSTCSAARSTCWRSPTSTSSSPLVELLRRPMTPNLRIQAALILGERRDRRPSQTRSSLALDDPDVNVRFHAIEALGRLGATEACDRARRDRREWRLLPRLSGAPGARADRTTRHRAAARAAARRRRCCAAPVIDALGELGDEDVVAPLVELLERIGRPTATSIADALAGLHERYEHGYGAGEHIAGLVRRGITARGTQRVLDAVHRVAADRLPSLAKVLGWLEGEPVQRALTRLLGHEAVRSQIVEALVRHGAGVVGLLIEQLHAEDLETRQAAARGARPHRRSPRDAAAGAGARRSRTDAVAAGRRAGAHRRSRRVRRPARPAGER